MENNFEIQKNIHELAQARYAQGLFQDPYGLGEAFLGMVQVRNQIDIVQTADVNGISYPIGVVGKTESLAGGKLYTLSDSGLVMGLFPPQFEDDVARFGISTTGETPMLVSIRKMKESGKYMSGNLTIKVGKEPPYRYLGPEHLVFGEDGRIRYSYGSTWAGPQERKYTIDQIRQAHTRQFADLGRGLWNGTSNCQREEGLLADPAQQLRNVRLRSQAIGPSAYIDRLYGIYRVES